MLKCLVMQSRFYIKINLLIFNLLIIIFIFAIIKLITINIIVEAYLHD